MSSENRCSACGLPMIRAGAYEPEGVLPLHNGIKDSEGETWVCIHPHCPRGVQNIADMEYTHG